ncbi:MAG TPA: hypothetical protein VG675_19695 [Bryobacteraceae bacterium]|nr:hypothetical protein [Bryobacteraceae bacterium]
MKRAEALLVACMVFWLAGCTLRGKPKAAAVPPPPKPVTAQAPQEPPQQLSVPQTTIVLPPAQPVNPEALATTEPAPGPVENLPAAPRPPRRPSPTTSQQSRPAETAAPQQPPAQTAEPERPPIQEIVPADELKRLQASAQSRKKTVRQRVDQARARKLTSHEANVVARIESFLKQSDDAEARGDMSQADALAGLAEVLSRELVSAK